MYVLLYLYLYLPSSNILAWLAIYQQTILFSFYQIVIPLAVKDINKS